jgi:hypothetical protein
MKTKADLQMRLAEIKIRGYIKDWDEFLLLYLIMTGQVDMPEGALYEPGSKDAKDLRKGRGLFNPLKRIETTDKGRLKRFMQHFPMLFKAGENPDQAISRIGDWLYSDAKGAAGASEWMELINPTAGGRIPAQKKRV